MRLALIIALVVAVASCTPPPPPPPPLKAASADQAGDIVRAFLDAAKAGDAALTAERMCGAQADARERAATALAGPLRITSYDIARIEPAWVGAEPYFRVDVTLHKPSLLTLARSRCARARGASIGCRVSLSRGAKRPDVGEISL